MNRLFNLFLLVSKKWCTKLINFWVLSRICTYCFSFVDLLNQIAADLRSVVPPTAIAPDETQHYPTVGQVLKYKEVVYHGGQTCLSGGQKRMSDG